MTQFKDPNIGTSLTAPINYALHKTGVLIVSDLFHSGYLTECIRMVEALGPLHKLLLAQKGTEANAPPDQIKAEIGKADDLIRWTGQMQEEGFHTIHSQVFVTLWAAHETGTENAIAATLKTIQKAAESAASRFSKARYEMAAWPWSDETCLQIAQKLDSRAKDKTPDGGWDAYARLVTLSGWLGIAIAQDPGLAARYNEAALARNVIVHRYGRLSAADADRAPHLARWVGKTLPITRDRLSQYHQAIVDVHLALCQGVWANGWK